MPRARKRVTEIERIKRARKPQLRAHAAELGVFRPMDLADEFWGRLTPEARWAFAHEVLAAAIQRLVDRMGERLTNLTPAEQRPLVLAQPKGEEDQ